MDNLFYSISTPQSEETNYVINKIWTQERVTKFHVCLYKCLDHFQGSNNIFLTHREKTLQQRSPREEMPKPGLKNRFPVINIFYNGLGAHNSALTSPKMEENHSQKFLRLTCQHTVLKSLSLSNTSYNLQEISQISKHEHAFWIILLSVALVNPVILQT